MSKDYYSDDIDLEADQDLESSISINVPEVDLPIGSVIQDRYEVIEYLGNGTSAVVYKCLDRLLGNLIVAVKVISADVVDDPVATTRLYRELLTNFDFDHENIARFYECIRGPGYIGLVMEFVKGGTLEDLFEDNHRFAPEETRLLLLQICEALTVIHKAGIVHRDLKPENVLLNDSGVVKISDFGLARSESAMEESTDGGETLTLFSGDSIARKATVTGGVAGSPLYLAPEYIANGSVTARSDIYAIGVIGYQLLTGQEPYPHESLVEMLKAKLREPPPSIKKINPEAPDELIAIVEKAMQIKPSKRYASVEEIVQTLRMLNFGSMSQIYSQAYIVQQIKEYEQKNQKTFVQMLFHIYLWPFKLIVDVLSILGSVGFALLVISAITISFILFYLTFGTALGFDVSASYDYIPNDLLPFVERLRAFGEQ